MAVNTQIDANSNESSASVIRRFSRRVKSSGILPKAKSLRYSKRNVSKTLQKKQTLRLHKKRREIDRKIKLGKIKDTRKKHTPVGLDSSNSLAGPNAS